MALPAWLGCLAPKHAAPHLRLGRRGERAAAAMLRHKGFRILARNLQTPGGEADLVCLDRQQGCVVLVEVKTRIQPGDGPTVSPTTAIHADKRKRLVATAGSLASHPRFRGKAVRIDVVTVEYRAEGDKSPTVRHYANAVTADGRLR